MADKPLGKETMSYSTFVAQKIDVALKIADGAAGGGYAESAILLAALTSGISADIWPGQDIDKKRFVELWAMHAETTLNPLKISVPLLTQNLREKGQCAAAELIEAARPKMFGLGYATRVLIGAEADMNESEISQLAASLTLRCIRKFSYASLFYDHVRCGLTHEFHVSENATQNPMTTRDAPVSYSNRESTSASYATKRTIHLKISWLAGLIRSINSNFGDSGPEPAQRPARWWIEG